MGEETIQIASRYSIALARLARLGTDAGHAELASAHGTDLARAVRDALDAVQAIHGAGTEAVRDWPEKSQRVVAQLARMRAALDRAGVDAEVRRMARTLVELIEPT